MTPHSQDESEDLAGLDLSQLFHYLHVLWRGKWVMLAVTALFLTGAYVYNQRQVPIFSATASFILNPRAPATLGHGVQAPVSIGTSTWDNSRLEYYKAQVKVLRSRSLATHAVASHKLDEKPEIIGDIEVNEATASRRRGIAMGALLGGLTINGPKDDRVVYVSVRHTDPKAAATLANAHVEAYVSYGLGQRTTGNLVASKWLRKELDDAEAELKKAELALFEYKEKNDLLYVSLKDQRNIIADRVGRFNTAINDTKVKRLDLGQERNQLKQLAKRDPLEAPVFESMSGADLTGSRLSGTGLALKREYYEAARKRDALAKSLGPQHPTYIAQATLAEKIRTSIGREAAIVFEATENRYQSLVRNEAALVAELRKQKTLAFALGPKEVEYNRLLRHEKNQRARHDLVQDRLRVSGLSGRQTTGNVEPLDSAMVPGAPINPTIRRHLAIALALSLLVGPGLVLLFAFADRCIKLPTEISQRLGQTVLGVIPRVHDKGANVALVSHRDPRSQVAEACRTIRTNLLYASADDPAQVVLVTSSSEREGKSTTVMQLGTVVAQGGQKVLLIESDLRRPGLHRANGIPGNEGLGDIIVGALPLEKGIKSTEVPGLYLLPGGNPPPNPSELIMTKKFEAMLTELRDQFDLIILDSPPVLAVTDAALLSRMADSVVFIVEAERTRREDAKRALQQLRQVNAPVAGVVLNSLDIRKGSYGYNYGYGYGYGYGRKGEPEPQNA